MDREHRGADEREESTNLSPAIERGMEDMGKVNASGRSPEERGRVADSIPSAQCQGKACKWTGRVLGHA